MTLERSGSEGLSNAARRDSRDRSRRSGALMRAPRPTVAGLLPGLLAIGGVVAAYSTQSASVPPVAATTPDVLQSGRCYRFTFWSQPSPNYKVLELVDGAWIKAEIDAGPSSAEREPVWINTAQIIAIRRTRCSD
jgi:hypothetical protein